jgi:hypothetical protein
LKFAYREYASGILTREECPILSGERLGCKGEKDGGQQIAEATAETTSAKSVSREDIIRSMEGGGRSE